jgi:type VI secretion system secreted protein Hcp
MNKQDRQITHKWSFLLLTLIIALASPNSFAALNAYMKITGETQGEIKGDVVQAGREDSILDKRYGYSVSASYDAASGLPSGKRQHRPIQILKEIDSATPLLFNALTNNETLTSVEIRFWKASGSGAEVQFYTIELVNAHIVSIIPSSSSADDDSLPIPARETINFTFEKIIMTIEDGGISSEDDWEKP